MSQITYDDGSTIGFTHDLGNRPTQVVDSISGTSTFVYDGLNRLTSKTTPQGTISYGYDNAGRMTSMTVTGQPEVNYTYDNADRLTQITRGPSTVSIGYDAAGRRTSLSLPNGVSTEYTYDSASQLTALTYKRGATVLGNLTYNYDSAGRRTQIGGTYARIGVPQSVASTNYNAANQQLGYGGQSLTYDLNGNLTSDGTNTYMWNARDQLVSISGPGLTASFQYDALGNRISKTVNGTATTYLYDGANIVQEQSGGLPSANILNGAIDEVFARTDSGGAWSPLSDGLGSTVALTDSSGTVQTEYTYEPFGAATFTGTANSNVTQYTGRENDSTGLHYYRARYYSPSLHRFISQDPIGISGGINVYAYVANNPISYRDPFGLDKNGNDFISGLYGFVNSVTGFLQNILLPAAAMEAGAPMIEGLGVAVKGGTTGGDTYEIIDGVRRAKAAQVLGRKTIPAEIVDEFGNTIGKTDLPIESLRSPKDIIEVGRKIDMDRWLDTYQKTQAGSQPPPILVTPGSRGLEIPLVGFGPGRP